MVARWRVRWYDWDRRGGSPADSPSTDHKMALSTKHTANRAALSAAANAAGLSVGAYLNSEAHQAERDQLFSAETYAAMYAARTAAVTAAALR